MPGIITSSRIRSGFKLPFATRKALSPDVAASTRYFGRSNSLSTCKFTLESSTIKTIGVFAVVWSAYRALLEERSLNLFEIRRMGMCSAFRLVLLKYCGGKSIWHRITESQPTGDKPMKATLRHSIIASVAALCMSVPAHSAEFINVLTGGTSGVLLPTWRCAFSDLRQGNSGIQNFCSGDQG